MIRPRSSRATAEIVLLISAITHSNAERLGRLHDNLADARLFFPMLLRWVYAFDLRASEVAARVDSRSNPKSCRYE
jgi:hypothetical protein